MTATDQQKEILLFVSTIRSYVFNPLIQTLNLKK